jgi:two-component system OmpR family response regulator
LSSFAPRRERETGHLFSARRLAERPVEESVLRVLIVEDEPDLLLGLGQVLREDGYAVDLAADGEEGLAKAKSWDYDVIVLDLMLPIISGLELLKRLRQEQQTPVLVLTAKDTLDDRIRGLDSGADDYLIKPFAISELRARLRALIRRAAGQGDSIIRLGAVTVDTAARRVTCDDQLVTLTAREYRLVELLALHRQKVVTRTMIYDHLFDENHDSLSNLVDVYISRLRSKLGKEFITTRRGEGYIVDV